MCYCAHGSCSTRVASDSVCKAFSSLVPAGSDTVPLISGGLLLSCLSFSKGNVSLGRGCGSFCSSNRCVKFLSRSMSSDRYRLSGLNYTVRFCGSSGPFRLASKVAVRLCNRYYSSVLLRFAALRLAGRFMRCRGLDNRVVRLSIPTRCGGAFCDFAVGFLGAGVSGRFLGVSSVEFSGLVVLRGFGGVGLLRRVGILSSSLPVGSLRFSIIASGPLSVRGSSRLFLCDGNGCCNAFCPRATRHMSRFGCSMGTCGSVRGLSGARCFRFSTVRRPLSRYLCNSCRVYSMSNIAVSASRLVGSCCVDNRVPVGAYECTLYTVTFTDEFVVSNDEDSGVVLEGVPRRVDDIVSSDSGEVVKGYAFAGSGPFSTTVLDVPRCANVRSVRVGYDRVVPRVSSASKCSCGICFGSTPVMVLSTRAANSCIRVSGSLGRVFFRSDNNSVMLGKCGRVVEARRFGVFGSSKAGGRFGFGGFGLNKVKASCVSKGVSSVRGFIGSGNAVGTGVVLSDRQINSLVRVRATCSNFGANVVADVGMRFNCHSMTSVRILR